jgi:hypothetical protein
MNRSRVTDHHFRWHLRFQCWMQSRHLQKVAQHIIHLGTKKGNCSLNDLIVNSAKTCKQAAQINKHK